MIHIYAGVGTDAKKIIKNTLTDPDVHSVILVDPDLSKMKMLSRFGKFKLHFEYFEDYIEKLLIQDPKIFMNTKIFSDRMIEHIPLGRLVTLTFPLIDGLVKHFNIEAYITYPDIDLIHKTFNKMSAHDIHTHEMCNIEAIAFGDHKVLLNDRLMQYYFDTYYKSEEKTIDGKKFYKCMHLKSMKKKKDLYADLEKYFQIFTKDQGKDLSQALWEFSNNLDYSDKNVESHIFLYEYISKEKVDNFYITSATRFIPIKENLFIDQEVVRILTAEKHFEIVESQNVNWYNEIHPYKRIVAFKKV